VTQWGIYFKDLYTPSESKDFDEPWRLVVEESVDRACNELRNVCNGTVYTCNEMYPNIAKG